MDIAAAPLEGSPLAQCKEAFAFALAKMDLDASREAVRLYGDDERLELETIAAGTHPKGWIALGAARATPLVGPAGQVAERRAAAFFWAASPAGGTVRPVRNRFDQLAKQIGQEALGPSGTTVASDEISPETQHADLRHEPDPAREAERARLGLLGRLAAVLCLIEIYGHAPDAEELRACLAKHIAFWQQRARKARAHNRKRKEKRQPPAAFVEPFLWILAAGAPTALLLKLRLEAAPDWPAGVYFFGADVLRVGIVVASELPRDRSSLLVRLMAAGPLLPQAVEELAALPPDAHERSVAEQILLNMQHALGKKPSRTPDEQEFIMTMQNTWEKARETGWEAGRDAGRTEEAARAVLTALRVRGLAVPDAARERILAQKDPELLQRWLEKAIVATSVGELIDALS
jgi:hypothetical protein